MITIAVPIVVLVAFLAGAAVFASLRHAPPSTTRAPNAIASKFFVDYVLWIVSPFVRRVSIAPNLITLISFVVALSAAASIACGWYAVAAWQVVVSGLLDILDGHVARRTGRSSRAGAFLDSVTDRWGELVIAAALVFALRGSALGTAAALAAIAGAQMVSYTRARGESLGIQLDGGTMQRPERIVAVSAALLLGGIGHGTGAFDGELVMALILGALGIWTCITALQRLRDGMRALATDKARAPARSDTSADKAVRPLAVTRARVG
jgi:CDP-diacylglycerol--glycerol-3-phosphate 3-phosphatidyltransferase